MNDRKPLRLRQLLAVCYGLAAALWVASWLWGGFVLLRWNLQGQMPRRAADAQELSYEGVAFYAENGWTLEGIYADKGISGTSVKKRDEFNRMIRRCKQGKIDMIITKSIA